MPHWLLTHFLRLMGENAVGRSSTRPLAQCPADHDALRIVIESLTLMQ